ncbi:MAG: photosynthetic reaction center cytochrome c subunit family protein [Anaerolineae bacterium]
MLENVLGGKRNAFILIFLGIAGILFLSAWWVVGFVNSVVQVDDPTAAAIDELSPIYVNFRADVDEYVSAASYLAMAAYQAEHEQPRNVVVLEGESTQEINGYMMNYFVAGLNVNCTYCHNINNFAAGPGWEGEDIAPPTEEGAAPHPEWENNKSNATRHLELVQDLNRNWLTQLPGLTDQRQPSGSQIICATCHNGQAQFLTYPEDQRVLPDDFRLPLDESYDLAIDNDATILNVNARSDISLDTVQYQQQVMYHMNASLNVGCTHCHNSRYFPSQEVPAIHYAYNMVQMSQYIWLNYGTSMGAWNLPDDATEEELAAAMQMPSCNMCHQGAIIPPGAAVSADILPDPLVAVSDD